MEYTKTNWVNGETALNADNMNNIEDGIERAKTEINTLGGEKFDKTSIVEEFGNAKDKVVSQDFFSNNVRWGKVKGILLDETSSDVTLKPSSDVTLKPSSAIILELGDLGRTLYNDISIKVELPSEPSTTDDILRLAIYDGSKFNYTNLQIFSTDITLAHYMFKRCGGAFILYEIKPLSNGGINSSSIKYVALNNATQYLDKVDKIEISRFLPGTPITPKPFLSGTKFTIYAN